MSRITLHEQASVPSTPGTDQVSLYVDTTYKQLHSIDDAGVVTDYYNDLRACLWFDHFVTGNPGDTDEFGAMGWRTEFSGGAGSNVLVVAGEVGRPGIARLEAGTGATGRGEIHLGDSSVGQTLLVSTTQNEIFQEWMVRPGGSLTAVNCERITVGLGDVYTADSEHANGVYIRFTVGTDTYWTLVTANGSSRTTSASTTSPAVGTWVKLGIKITYPAGVPTAQMYINGAAAGTPLTATWPTAGVSPGAGIFAGTAVATEAFLDIDWTIGLQLPT